MAKKKLLTKKQRAINVDISQKKYQQKARETRTLIPQYHINRDENESVAVPVFERFKTKKEAMFLGLQLLAKLNQLEIDKILNK